MAEGEALDLLHGTSVAGDQKIYAGGYDRCADSDVVVITAGLRRKPDESRLDLINRNVTLFQANPGFAQNGGAEEATRSFSSFPIRWTFSPAWPSIICNMIRRK